MKKIAWSLGLAFCLAVGAGACDSQVGDAFKSFNEFSTGKSADPYGAPQEKVNWKERRWLNKSQGGRARAVADLEVRADLSKKDLERLMRDAIHHKDVQRNTSVIKVRVWPGRLEQLAAPLGMAFFARDGHGWDGKGVGFEKIFVYLPTGNTPPRPSLDEHHLAESVELRMGTGEALPDAIKSAAKRMGGDADVIRKTVVKVQKYYDAVRKRMPTEERGKKQ